MKSDIFMDSDRMRLYLQIKAESIVITVIIIVVIVGQFANEKCAPAI